MSYRPSVREDSKAPPYFYYPQGNYTHYKKTSRITYGDMMADIGTLRAPYWIKAGAKMYEVGKPTIQWIWRNRKDLYYYYKYLRGIGHSANYALWEIQKENEKKKFSSENTTQSSGNGRINPYNGSKSKISMYSKYNRRKFCRCRKRWFRSRQRGQRWFYRRQCNCGLRYKKPYFKRYDGNRYRKIPKTVRSSFSWY